MRDGERALGFPLRNRRSRYNGSSLAQARSAPAPYPNTFMSDLSWRLQRIGFFFRRLNGSLAARGWAGTLQRIKQERVRARGARLASEPILKDEPSISPTTRRILIVDAMAPDPTRDSGSVRLLHIFDALRAEGWHVDFFADDGIASTDDMARLAMLGVRTHGGDLRRWLIDKGAGLDAVMLCRLHVARQHLAIVRKYAPQATVAFDTVDLHYVRERRAAVVSGSSRMLRQAQRSQQLETDVIGEADVTFVVSSEEQTILSKDIPQAHIVLLSNIHEPSRRTREFTERRDLLFVGGFGHPPNADAMQWFVADILPRIQQAEPDIKLHIVGDIDDLSRQCMARDGVIVHGRVADLLPLIEASRLSVAPLRFGAGVKGKVNQAMSHGLPVVLTTIAAEGMHITQDVDGLLADTPEDFAAAVLRAYRDEALWLRLSDAGPENIRAHFSSNLARQALRAAFQNTRRP